MFKIIFQRILMLGKPMAEKTLRDFFVPSTANVATGPNIDVGDVNFEPKSNLINMVLAHFVASQIRTLTPISKISWGSARP
jgi:hypothetical protein